MIVQNQGTDVRKFLLTLVLLAYALPAAARDLPPGFVYLRDIDPSIAQDMRYASPDNFTGQPLPGYDAPECVLRRDAALALRQVQADLARIAHEPEKWEPVFGKDHVPGERLSLKTYDCYRPTRAVAAMARWSQSRDDGRTKRFYPALEKRTLFASGYIAARSAHSTGTAIDLTLIRLPGPAAAPYDPRASYGPCTASAAQRAPDTGIDMGTGFDCFDTKSHTAAIGGEPKRWRDVLGNVMRARGFHNYFREWWHFTYGPQPPQAYDFPIAPRGR